MNTQPLDPHPADLRALRDFVEATLSGHELRRLAQDLLGLGATNLLPGPPATLAQLADHVVQLLVRRGAIDHDFFDMLSRWCPRRVADLNRLRACWLPPRTSIFRRLPPEEFAFSGREAEMSLLRGVLGGGPSRHVAVLGPPGIGKSALALHVLYDTSVVESYRQRRLFVHLDTVASGLAVAEQVAATLGLPTRSDPTDTACEVLAKGPSLVVLDHLDSPWEQDRNGTEGILARLASVPSLSLIVTMRGAATPAGLPFHQVLRLHPLNRTEARELFVSIAPEHASSALLDRLLKPLGGVPQAIVLLARASQGNDLRIITRDFQARGTTMLQRFRPKSDRLASWRTSLEMSWKSGRMTYGARRLAAVLARVPDGVAVDDLPAVMTRPRDVTTLVHVGLAQFESGRLRMLAPIREHIGLHHVADAADVARMTEHYGNLARSLGPKIGHRGGAAALARLMPERANIITILDRALREQSNIQRWVKSSYALQNFARFSEHNLQPTFLAAAVVARQQGLKYSELRCLMAAGLVALTCSHYDEARSTYTTALTVAQELRLARWQARCFGRLADIAALNTESHAHVLFRQSLTLHSQEGSVSERAFCLRGLGFLALYQQQPRTAIKYFETAQRLFDPRSPFGVANCSLGFGDVAVSERSYNNATRHYRIALDHYRSIGALTSQVRAYERLGNVAIKLNELEEASAWYESALSILLQLKSTRSSRCLHVLGKIARCLGNREEAARYVHAKLRLFRDR